MSDDDWPPPRNDSGNPEDVNSTYHWDPSILRLSRVETPDPLDTAETHDVSPWLFVFLMPLFLLIVLGVMGRPPIWVEVATVLSLGAGAGLLMRRFARRLFTRKT
jgi:hypothetical protein